VVRMPGDPLIEVRNHRTVARIQRQAIKKSKRNSVSRLFHAKNDKETIAAWKLGLNGILHIFNVRSVGFFRQSLTAPLSDRAGNQYSYDGYGYASYRVDKSGRY